MPLQYIIVSTPQNNSPKWNLKLLRQKISWKDMLGSRHSKTTLHYNQLPIAQSFLSLSKYHAVDVPGAKSVEHQNGHNNTGVRYALHLKQCFEQYHIKLWYEKIWEETKRLLCVITDNNVPTVTQCVTTYSYIIVCVIIYQQCQIQQELRALHLEYILITMKSGIRQRSFNENCAFGMWKTCVLIEKRSGERTNQFQVANRKPYKYVTNGQLLR